jgi:hypothetical protein
VGRSKKRPTEHRRGPAEAAPSRAVPSSPAPLPVAPPRRSRLFLALAGLLLLAWMAFLGVLAVLY